MPLPQDQHLQRTERVIDLWQRLDNYTNYGAYGVSNPIRALRTLEEATAIVQQRNPGMLQQGYHRLPAIDGYGAWLQAFQVLDHQLTPANHAAIDRASNILQGLRDDFATLGEKPTEGQLAAYKAQKMSQLQQNGEVFLLTGHRQHFNIVRIRQLPDGSYSHTLYDAGHETTPVGTKIDEHGQRRDVVNAVEERQLKTKTNIGDIIEAHANKIRSYSNSREYAANSKTIDRAMTGDPIRTETDWAQRRWNCTTRGQRIFLEDIIQDPRASERLYDFITNENQSIGDIRRQLTDQRQALAQGQRVTPVAETHEWSSYHSGQYGDTQRYSRPFPTNDETAIRQFTEQMEAKGVTVQWGKKGDQSYAYVLASDAASTRNLQSTIAVEAKLQAGERAAQSIRTDLEHVLKENGNNILHVERTDGGYKITVPDNFSRANMAATGIDASQIKRINDSASQTSTITVPDSAIPQDMREKAAAAQKPPAKEAPYEHAPELLETYRNTYGTQGAAGVHDLRVKTVDREQRVIIRFNGEVSTERAAQIFGVSPARMSEVAKTEHGYTRFELPERELEAGRTRLEQERRANAERSARQLAQEEANHTNQDLEATRRNRGQPDLDDTRRGPAPDLEATRGPSSDRPLRPVPAKLDAGGARLGEIRLATAGDMLSPHGIPAHVPPPHMLPAEPARLGGGKVAGIAGMAIATIVAGYELFHGRPAEAAVSLAGGLPVPGASTAMTAAVGGDIGESLQSEAKSLIGGILGGAAAGAAFGPPGAVAGGVVGGVMAAMPAPPEDQDRTAAHLNLLSPQGQMQFATVLNSLPAKPAPSMSPALRELVIANAAMERAVGKPGEEAASRELLRVYHNLIDDPKAMREVQAALGLDCPIPGLNPDAAAQARAAGRQATAQLPATEGQVAANDKAPQGERIQFRQF